MVQCSYIIQIVVNIVMLSEYSRTTFTNGQVRQNNEDTKQEQIRPVQHRAVPLDGELTKPSRLVTLVLAALDRTVDFYEKNYASLNFDGIFGAKVVEGQLNLVVAKYSKGFLSDVMDTTMKNDISRIASRAGHIVKLASPHLHEKYPENMKRLKQILHLSWDIGHSHRRIDKAQLWSYSTRLLAKPDSFNELESDHCIAELLEPVGGVACFMTEACQQLMTKPGRDSYALVHQILYTMIAEMSGCGSRLEKWLVKHKRSDSVEQLQSEMCSNLYVMAIQIASAISTLDVKQKDLLSEMEFTCGMLGFFEFLKREWLISTLQWQSGSGCFPDNPVNHTTERKLLEEQILPDGCRAHLTAVAASALTVHLHYLLQGPGVPEAGHDDKSNRQAGVVPPPPMLQPPPPGPPTLTSSGVLFRHQYLRGRIDSGINRVADQDKSLEDKADIVMQHLEEMKTSTKVNISRTLSALSPRPRDPLRHSNKIILPEQAMPFAQYLSSTKSAVAIETSVAPFYFVISSIALVLLVMVRYVLSKRRAHSIFRSSFRI